MPLPPHQTVQPHPAQPIIQQQAVITPPQPSQSIVQPAVVVELPPQTTQPAAVDREASLATSVAAIKLDETEEWNENATAAEDKEEEEEEAEDEVGDAVEEAKPKKKIVIREYKAKKEPVNVIFCGHVDAGKSTIGGQIMYLTGMVDKRTLEKYEREAKEKNRETWYLSWALDTNIGKL